MKTVPHLKHRRPEVMATRFLSVRRWPHLRNLWPRDRAELRAPRAPPEPHGRVTCGPHNRFLFLSRYIHSGISYSQWGRDSRVYCPRGEHRKTDRRIRRLSITSENIYNINYTKNNRTRRFIAPVCLYPWASLLKGATFLRRFCNLPFLSSLAPCSLSLSLSSRALRLHPFLRARLGDGGGAGGREGERRVAVRQPSGFGPPWQAEGCRGGADGAVGDADRGLLEEDRVPRREAGRRDKEIQARVPEYLRVAGAGEYRFGILYTTYFAFPSNLLFLYFFVVHVYLFFFVEVFRLI